MNSLTSFFEKRNLNQNQIDQLEMFDVTLLLLDYSFDGDFIRSLNIRKNNVYECSAYRDLSNTEPVYALVDHKTNEMYGYMPQDEAIKTIITILNEF
ncbi:hypothetical protein D3C76_03530 [compost metagenome]